MANKARLTKIGLQAEVKQSPKVRTTNVGLQAEVKQKPYVRLTNIAIQVELGTYFLKRQRKRTRPVPAKARVLPMIAKSRHHQIDEVL